MSQKVLIGKISAVFGVKGQVKIVSYCENPQEIVNYSLFDKNGEAIFFKISSLKKKSGSQTEILIATIDGVHDRNAAEKLIGHEIFTNRDEFEELNEDEFYLIDLIGLEVIDDKKNKLGKIKNVIDHGAGSIVEIEFIDSVQQEFNLLKYESFAFKNEFFPKIDLKQGFAILSVPEFISAKDINSSL